LLEPSHTTWPGRSRRTRVTLRSSCARRAGFTRRPCRSGGPGRPSLAGTFRLHPVGWSFTRPALFGKANYPKLPLRADARVNLQRVVIAGMSPRSWGI
jgi:hypothetical protein